jgi:hypothetical protein
VTDLNPQPAPVLEIPNRESQVKVSVVLPIFNEEESIQIVIPGIVDTLGARADDSFRSDRDR